MDAVPTPQTSNFGFLAEYDPLFAQLGLAAEAVFSNDPNSTLIKLQQLGEAMAQHLAAQSGIEFDEKTSQSDLLYRLNRELRLESQVKELFHTLRIEGNKATHQFRTRHKEAMDGLKLARELAIWFHRSFGKAGASFKPGPFIPPADPSAQLRQLQGDIEKLRHELQQTNIELSSSQQLAQLIETEKTEYEALAVAMDEESRTLNEQAQQHERALSEQQQAYEEKIKALQYQLTAQGEQTISKQRDNVAKKTQTASNSLVLSEELTRIIIDNQLNEAGWEADSQELTWQKGARPEKGSYRAIAEWPTTLNSNKGRALPKFHTPGGLLSLLERDRENAETLLKNEPFGYLKLRDYQQTAILATEHALAQGVRSALLAMATGTGKTRTIIGLMYRFLKTERFHRILFLVDRTALGQQAIDAFNEAPLEQNHTLSKIYNVAELGQLSQKLMRVLRKADHNAESKPALKQRLDELHEQWGVEPKSLHRHLHQLGPRQAAEFLREHSGLVNQLEDIKTRVGSDYMPLISQHEDEIRDRTQSYGVHQRPEDYLDSFNQFVRDQLNQSAALSVVVNKPRDLTREQLKEVRLLLDNHGYSEANLQSAVRNQTNKDIAASIVGHIRRAALGEALKPFEQRVTEAMDHIYTDHSWTPSQRKWLQRLAQQLVHEVIIDRDFVNNRFADDGGAKQMDRVLGEQLDTVLDELSEAMWPSAGQS